MYAVTQNKGLIQIRRDEHRLIDGLTPILTLDTGETVPLTLTGEAAGIFTYADAEERTKLTLSIDTSGDSIVCKLQLSRANPWYTFASRFDADKGVCLRMTVDGDGFFTLRQGSLWWLDPAFCNTLADIPHRTQSILWQKNGQYGLITAVCDERVKTLFDGGETLSLYMSHGAGRYTGMETVCFVLGAAAEPFGLAETVMRDALRSVNAPTKTRDQKTLPPMFEYLGWCSWDAFYRGVSETGLLQKADELAAKQLPVNWFIIDDGWQDVENERLQRLAVNPEKFPRGLKPLVDDLKSRYGLRWMGIWHAMLGHWNGIDPQESLYQDNPALFTTAKDGRTMPAPDEAKAFAFFAMIHAYVASCGFDFVKVDGQGSLSEFVKDDVPIGEAARRMLRALDASVGAYFHGHIINCMGMASELVFNRPSGALSRNSDDFYPKRANGFKKHALTNAYNAFTHGQVYWCDWDMFWTRHVDARQNALFRAVSGGPVYVSDPVGETDPAVLWPLILRDGKILRCDKPGLPTADCLLVNPAASPVPLKVWNTVGDAGVVAAFNVHMPDADVTGTFSPSDIPGLAGTAFAVSECFSGAVFEMAHDEKRPVSLAANETLLYRVTPVRDGFAAVGLTEKYIAAATIKSQACYATKRCVTLYEGGRFLFLSHTAPTAVRVNGVLTTPVNDGHFYWVDCAAASGEVLVEIEGDFAAATKVAMTVS